MKKLKIYWEYFKYIMEHKKHVFAECWEEGLYLHAFTHDMSKFHPKEFFAYALWFHSPLGINIKGKSNKDIVNMGGLRNKAIMIELESEGTFEIMKEKHKKLNKNFYKAWQHHKNNNKHHQHYWYERNLPMPVKHIKEMVCDLKAMGKGKGNSAEEYYLDNYNKIKFSDDDNKFCSSRHNLELRLGLLDYGIPWCECNYEVYMTIQQVIDESEEYFKKHGRISNVNSVQECINDQVFKPVVDKLGVNVYEKCRRTNG